MTTSSQNPKQSKCYASLRSAEFSPFLKTRFHHDAHVSSLSVCLVSFSRFCLSPTLFLSPHAHSSSFLSNMPGYPCCNRKKSARESFLRKLMVLTTKRYARTQGKSGVVERCRVVVVVDRVERGGQLSMSQRRSGRRRCASCTSPSRRTSRA
jgi:hypothetical protein